MVRTREELAERGDLAAAVEAAWAGSGPGVVVGGMTTAGAFGIVALADDPTARHLGLSGFVGLALCLVLMLTWLPAAWALLGGAGKHRGPLHVPLLRPIAKASARRPALTLLLGALVMAAAVAGFPRFHYETDLAKVFSRDVPALEVADRVQELFGVNPGPWVLRAESVEEARSFSTALESDTLFSRADRLADLFHGDWDERTTVLAEPREAVSRRQVVTRNMLFLAGPKTEQMHQFLELLGILEQAVDRGPPSLDGARTTLERLRVQQLDPSAAGIGITLEVTMEGDRPWLVPVWTGPGFNVMTMVVVPLVVGLGVDDGVHVVHRIREQPDLPIHEATARVGQAIVMTTTTTCASFLLLFLFSGHVGLEGMSRVLLIGLPVCLLGSITLVPALMALGRARTSS